MAFNRVKRRLSTLATGSNYRKARTTTETRSYSGSSVASTSSGELISSDEFPAEGPGYHHEAVTYDRLLTNDEVLAVAPGQNSLSVPSLHNEPVHGDLGNHKDQLTPVNITENFPPLPIKPAVPVPVPSPVPIKALNTASSSRRTSIFVGNPEQRAIQDSKQGPVNDEARRELELKYYEFTDQTGTNRRRSMLRSVSKDDYLLCRGANPRTGVVTPGIHSASSSWEEFELLKQRGIVLPSKWRQRGDQWVSLDMGEPTPLSTTPQGARIHQSGRPLRTPPRLTSGKYNHNPCSKAGHRKSSVSELLPEDMPTPDNVPGTFPLSPQGESSSIPALSRAVPGPVVKRKPVGIPAKDSKNDLPQNQVTQQVSAGTILRRPFVIQPRSSSAATLQLADFESPDYVGKPLNKILPSKPNASTHGTGSSDQNIEIFETFLGRKPDGQAEGVPESRTPALSSQEKELPCLPMSNGQYQSQASNPGFETKPHAERTGDDNDRKVIGPRGGDPAYPYVRNMRMAIPPRHHQFTTNVPEARNIDDSMMSIPTYDNPPLQTSIPQRQMRRVIDGPRPMHQPRSMSKNIRNTKEIFTNVPFTTSTNTRIPTYMSTLQPSLQGRWHRNGLAFEVNKDQEMCQHTQERIYPKDPRQRSTTLIINAPMRWPQNRPRAHSRPQMPDRENAHMRSVPRMSHRYNKQVGCMESQHPWRMTGTSESARSETSGVSAASTTRFEIDPRLLPNPLGPNTIEDDEIRSTNYQNCSTVKPVERMGNNGQEDYLSQSSGLTRKCSRCHSGFVKGSLRSIAGRAPPSSSGRLTEECQGADIDHQPRLPDKEATETRKIAAPKSESTDEVDERDHTACCTECCTKEDCHEGCLGHPSPSICSFDGSTVIDSDEASSSPERGSPSFPPRTNTRSSPTKSKLSFVQGLRMRKTLRTRLSPDDGKTIKERSNALDSPPIELDSHPLSPGSFWEGGGGAASAAKKVLGDKNTEGASTKTNAKEAKRVTSGPKLVIPKIRELRKGNSSEAGRWKSARPPTRIVGEASSATAVLSTSRSRNVSGQSMLSIEAPYIISNLGTVNLAGVLEMAKVPFEAAAIWIQNHPEVRLWLWKVVEKAVEMAKTVTRTGGLIWEISYVYSKTGRLRCKASGGIGELVVDCGRSVGYLLVFGAVGMCLGRVLSFVLGLLRGVLAGFGVVGWVLKRLGMGLLW